MLDHVLIRVTRLARSMPPLRAALATLGIEPQRQSGTCATFGTLRMVEADAAHPTSHGVHVALIARSIEQVEAFWTADTAAGLRDDGAPGPRPQYGDDYVAAFLRDADDNSIEAVVHSAAPLVSATPGDSLLLLPGAPSRGLHLAYPADEQAVRRFHDDAKCAGFRSDGACVVDPDGTTVELVATARR